MPDDPTIRWTLASPYGIQRNEAEDAWHSGHANDILELDTGQLLVATETGGVWMVDPTGGNLALSDDWANPDLFCLAFGPDDPRHVFAGCSGGIIRETDLNQPIPFLAWREIANPVPEKAGIVYRIVIIRNLRRIIAACAGGLFWAVIPPTRQSPRPPYNWKEARVKEGQGFHDLAIAATRDTEARSQLEDRRAITIVAGGLYSGGIYVGQWNEADELVMKRASVHRDDGSLSTDLFDIVGTTSLSSCEQRPTVLYAGCAWPDGRVFRVLRSKDGGGTWRICQGSVPELGDELTNLAGDFGADWTNCIAAHPTNPGMAMLGWVPRFLTLDGGKTWRQVDSVHLHPDQQGLRFYPEVAGPVHNLYIASDGGVARVNLDDYLNPPGNPFQSNYNRQLPTLQFYSTLIRMFWGTLGASRTIPWLVSAGSQDNGNLCCRLGPAPTPWIDISGGDGGWNAFIADGALLHNSMGEAVVATTFNPMGGIVSATVVPKTQPPDPVGLKGPYGEAVVRPTYRNESGKVLQAVASNNNEVFGLYVDEIDSPRYSWESIASIPAGEAIAALGSYRGATIFAGTMRGKMYAIDTRNGSVLETPIVLPKPTPSAKISLAAITRIVFFRESEVFAILNGATATINKINPVTGAKVTTTLTSYYVIKLDGLKWVVTPGIGLTNQPMYALEAIALPNSEVERALMVATDDHVYISRDDGATWQPAGLGLPRNPHCSDLRFVSIDNEAWLYLATYGRSVWVAKLR